MSSVAQQLMSCYVNCQAHLAERLGAARASRVRACYIMADSADELLRELQLILHVAVLIVVDAATSHVS